MAKYIPYREVKHLQVFWGTCIFGSWIWAGCHDWKNLWKKKKEKKESHEIEEFTLSEKKTNHRHVSKYIQNNVSLIKDSNESSIVCMDN